MAYIFRREGTKSKRGLRHRCGIEPWIDHFRWRVVEWHYKFSMGPTAQRALRSHQSEAEKLQYIIDHAKTGQTKKFLNPSKRFYFRTALPNVVPYRRSSNPFCPVSSNVSGFSAWIPQKRPEPHCKDPKHEIAGTDDARRPMPRY
uniref:Uncharacterized protein n=1 Tax=Chromera velia CCMP2878 TaxID=1169474 RepID=A0A0G4FWT5_9ALVE|mmetsp:Transcript_9937/g.19278  ORF Transcript_9937/g.19278 Transcript_9937/m.19278 type:complete len:145 (+) Transcript_9937:197-631(+)|eukprot:Cvel_19071.t1-p1 / transcript=Cvel_19071.t1 / gene=Cvel_19071 / organism=Chromera_velia_CCMP2878 / gene_product=hypothetical protein / transcript_product=hypothetical protein / location=Cvel_scaffold1618:34086-35727(-) / protein_length=144 / sequence_SO=supercontig / SO=protein_coding / is_pseudo=false